MADFKDELSPALVRSVADDLARAWDGFDGERFVALATAGLDAFAMKARIRHIAAALAACMPDDAHDAADVVRAALAADGLDGWASLPVDEYVAVTMIDEPDLGLGLLADLTSRFTAEFAVRAFVEQRYDVTMRRLSAWTTHPDEHVRRLVSEGTRPRLPWGQRLTCFVEDPAPALWLLEELFDDESLYVRRSVANHLNDVSKDHPGLARATARRWAAASTHGDFVARHGLRTLVKQGDPEALRILGVDTEAVVDVDGMRCSPSEIEIGDEVTFEIALTAEAATRAVVDYVVHYQGANGPKAGKVFKLSVRDLAAGEPVVLTRRHRFAHVASRRIRPGVHRIEVQVNGRVRAAVEVVVTEGTPAGPAYDPRRRREERA